MSAVFSASGLPSRALTVLGLFPSTLGSASLTLPDNPSPLSTRTALCPVDSLKMISMSSYPSIFIVFKVAMISSVPSLILPARLSVIIPSSSDVEKLHLNAMSPGITSTPTPTASNGPLPVYTSYGL